MQITASINTRGKIKDRVLTFDEEGHVVAVREEIGAPERWVISPKFETPILDFTNASVTTPISGAGTVSRGMWHQYGNLPTDASRGIFLKVSNMPLREKNSASLTGSLADLVGFRKGTLKLGQPAQTKKVFEAIVAVPFVLENNRQNFFEIDRNQIQLAEQILKNPSRASALGIDASDLPGPSILQMVEKMQKYILPPHMDFLFNPDLTPFAMYVFEFEHVFSQQDLVDMWQNLSPELGRSFKEKEVVIEHELLPNEIFSRNFPARTRWMVFKVKQKAEKSYFAKTLSTADDDRFKFNLGKTVVGQNKRRIALEEVPEYSYNWPYDYFSMIELVKLEAGVILKGPEEE